MNFYSVSLPSVTPIKLVTGKATCGIGFLTAIFGSICSLFGMPNSMFAEKLERAEALAMEELEKSAQRVGADGVMDIRCQIDGLSFLVSGTAYKLSIEEKPKENHTKESATMIFPETENKTIICSQCKFEQSANRKVCWNCGASFSDS